MPPPPRKIVPAAGTDFDPIAAGRRDKDGHVWTPGPDAVLLCPAVVDRLKTQDILFDAECATAKPGGKLVGTSAVPGSWNKQADQCLFAFGSSIGEANISALAARMSDGFRLEMTVEFMDAMLMPYSLAGLADAETNVIVALFAVPASRTDGSRKQLKLFVQDKEDRYWICRGPIVSTGVQARVVLECDGDGIRLGANRDVWSFPPVVNASRVSWCHIAALNKRSPRVGLLGKLWYCAVQSLPDSALLARWDLRQKREIAPRPGDKSVIQVRGIFDVPDDSGNNCPMHFEGSSMSFVPGPLAP